jgi:hypothetical protein
MKEIDCMKKHTEREDVHFYYVTNSKEQIFY